AETAIRRRAKIFDPTEHTNLPRHLYTLTLNNLPRLLRSEDRNAMAFSIEARTPFLDVRLAEYISQLPAVYRVNNGWSKYVLRRAVDNFLPKEIVWRRDKKGFATPERAWLRDLRQPFNDLFREAPRIASFVEVKTVRAVLADDNLALSPTAAASVWRWVAAELWMRMIERR
ncbi:MAG TPA: asparagine synthase-related protein, partial [Anaerolineae bacterium]